MTQTRSQLNKLVMRRVWYVFFLSLFVNRGTVAGVTLGVSLGALFELVYVRAIVSNLLHTEVGEVPSYVLQSLQDSFNNGELLQLFLMCLVFVSLSYLLTVLNQAFLNGRGSLRSV